MSRGYNTIEEYSQPRRVSILSSKKRNRPITLIRRRNTVAHCQTVAAGNLYSAFQINVLAKWSVVKHGGVLVRALWQCRKMFDVKFTPKRGTIFPVIFVLMRR